MLFNLNKAKQCASVFFKQKVAFSKLNLRDGVEASQHNPLTDSAKFSSLLCFISNLSVFVLKLKGLDLFSVLYHSHIPSSEAEALLMGRLDVLCKATFCPFRCKICIEIYINMMRNLCAQRT